MTKSKIRFYEFVNFKSEFVFFPLFLQTLKSRLIIIWTFIFKIKLINTYFTYTFCYFQNQGKDSTILFFKKMKIIVNNGNDVCLIFKN